MPEPECTVSPMVKIIRITRKRSARPKLESLSQEKERLRRDDKVNLRTFPSIALFIVLPSIVLV
jgi:hypothetical protein